MRLQNTLVCLVCLSGTAGAESAPESDSVIVPPAGCRPSDSGWTLTREAGLSEILQALADSTCERFFVPRALLKEKLSIDVGRDPVSSFELHQRVEGALRARGIILEAAPASRVRRASDPPAALRISAAQLDKGIQCQGSRCSLTREIVDAMRADPAGLAASGRFVPSLKDGKPYGVKLLAVSAGGYFARLGLENGDLLHSFDDSDLSTPDKALELYAKIRSASQLKLGLERRGEKMTLEYLIK